MKKNYFLSLILLLGSTGLWAQSGRIQGIISSSDGKPSQQVTVTVKGRSNGATSDESGLYTIEKIKAGTYTLRVSFIGLKTQERQVEVRENETTQADFTLEETSEQLQEVIVTAANKYGKKESEFVARLPIKNLENPQVYSTISKELLKEQVITNFDDALKNAPGIDKLWTSTGRGGDGAAYFTMRGFTLQASMINGIAGLSNGGLDPANIERIELIKGPSSTLFGGSLINFGGLINMVTKKPYETKGGEITYTAGSFGLNRLTADINTPLTDKVLFRVNGAYHYEGSFQDAGFKRTGFIAPSIIYKASDRLNFHLNTELYTSEATNPLMVFLNRSRQLIATNPAELNIDWKRSFTANDITVKTPTLNIYGQMNYKLSDQWTSQTNVSRSVRRSVGLYSYVMFLDATRVPTDTLLSRYVGDQNSTSTTTDIQQNFIGDFRIGNLRNRLVAGLDYLNVQSNNYSSYVLFDNVNSVRVNDPRYGRLTRSAVDAKLATGVPSRNTTDANTYSAYASDVLNVTDQLLIMASIRFDRFDNKGSYNVSTGVTSGAYVQNAVSPKFGAIYQILKDRLSVFGNYMNGFRNVGNTTQPDGSISVFKPQQANQWEGGVKMEILKGKLSGNVSYYDIYVTNVTRPDPARVGYTIQDGNASSKGVEIDITANLFPGLNLIAGYSHNDSKNEKTDAGSIGRRPVGAGPADLVNAWISYSPTKGALKGFGVGVGGNYAGKNMITNSAATGIFTIPEYTVLNASLFYNTPAFRFALKADNFTNQQYWKGWTTVEVQKPASVSASIAFKY